jgi:hypothetical protein
MHLVVTAVFTARLSINARGVAPRLDVELVVGQSGPFGETAIAMADCKRARKTLPDANGATSHTICTSRYG